MGNGIGTALANRVAIALGSVADEVTVAPPTDDTGIEIALPDGVTVRVGRSVDGESLRRVLTALGR